MLELSKKAMLVTVNIKMEGLLGERRDKAATELVSDKYRADASLVKTAKYLINRKHPKVKLVVSRAQRVREIAYENSFAWGGTNLRMLPIRAHNHFNSKVVNAIEDLKAAWAEYELWYPSLVADAEKTLTGLGGLFDASQYPPKEKIKDLFQASVEYWPIPDSGHFVAEIAEEVAQDARETVMKNNTLRANGAINEMLGRVEKGVAKYVDKVASYKAEIVNDKRSNVVGIFRDSLVSNVRELAELTRRLNFSDDAGIDALANQVDRLARATAETLRDDPKLRETLVGEGRALIATLDSYRKTDSIVDDMIGEVRDYY
jgi:hypothetical protein